MPYELLQLIMKTSQSIAPSRASPAHLPAHSAERVSLGSSEHATVLSHLDACL